MSESNTPELTFRSIAKETERNRRTLNQYGGAMMGLLRFARDLVVLTSMWGSLPAEVFLRRRFGERYLTLITVPIGFVVLVLSINFAADLTDRGTYAILIVPPLYLIASIVHLIHILRRARDNTPWHSRSWGESLIPWTRIPKVTPWTSKTAVEPLFVICCGIGVLILQDPFGFVVIGSGLCMTVKAIIAAYTERQALLDVIDSQIESAAMAEAVSGMSDSGSHSGFMVSPGAQTRVAMEGAGKGLVEAKDSLLASLQDLLKSTPMKS